MAALTSAEIIQICRDLYIDGPWLARTLQRWRPYICPYHILVDSIPHGGRALDVGCGGGLFLGLLAKTGRITGGTGLDTSRVAISLADSMTHRLQSDHGLTFVHLENPAAWPAGAFSVVSMIDLLHHVPPSQQTSVLERAMDRVQRGGRFIYKDMAERPLWRALINRLHDLILARQWIHYMPIDSVLLIAETQGLALREHRVIDVLWYRHELAIFERPD